MSQPRTPCIPLIANRQGRTLAALFVIFLMVLTSLPESSVALARHPAPPEAASSQPQEPSTATPTPTPSEEELKLQQEKAILDLKKGIEADKQAIAEAQKAELEAKFPKPTTSPLSGETKISGALIESDMISYLSLAYTANRLVKQLRPLSPSNVAIYNQADVNLLLNYKVTAGQVEIMKQNYCALFSRDYIPDICSEPTSAPSPSPGLTPELTGEAAIPAVLPIAKSFLGAFVDLTSLLRTNVEIQGHTIDIDESAFAAEVFRAAHAEDGLRKSCKTTTNDPKECPHTALYYPAAFPPNIQANTGFELLAKLEVLHLLRALADELIGGLSAVEEKIKKAEDKADALDASLEAVKARIEASVTERERLRKVLSGIKSDIKRDEIILRIAELNELIVGLQGDQAKIETKLIPDNKTKLANLKGDRNQLLLRLQAKVVPNPTSDGSIDLSPIIARIKSVNAQFDNFVESLVKTEASSGVNALTAYLKAENINLALNDANSYWLQLKVIKAGGNNKIKTNLITDIFTLGARVSHSGGAIVEYILYDRDGKVTKSDTFTEYTGYIKANKITRLQNPKNVGDVPARNSSYPKQDDK